MKKQKMTLTKSDELKKPEESLLNRQKRESELSYSNIDNLKLIRELEMHQIELEVQNEELKLAKENAELAEKKYTELYDFAPSGYLTLTKTGEITELNFRAECLLGKSVHR